MEKIKSMIAKLEDRRSDAEESLQGIKKEFIKLIEKADSKTIMEIDTYTTHRQLINTARQIEELNIKIRTLEAVL